MIDNIFLYLRAARQQLWQLHLVALDNLVPYFFALDLQNHASMSPIYLSEMYNLAMEDQELLSAGSFCVAKTMIPFISIGVDHALEQKNKLMKIVRGIRNISIDENKLEQFFAICPLISKMYDQFQGMYNMKSNKRQTVRHELVGSSKEFLTKSVKLYKT